ncbi:hypothetical protein [Paenibacillus sp.]|uniref:hypothetical protein n=1 Tax=Paenibacillus sp. TaxID=58172 RepID=UPI002811C93D|nr:hypothetical protein [Paenibacillus sp.]
MIGTWRWNAVAACALAAVIFLLSYRSNPLATAGIRTGIAFAVTFGIGFAVRWLLGQALAGAESAAAAQTRDAEAADEAAKGQSIDIVTPEDEEEAGLDLGFAPLSPPKLAKTESPIDPELLAQALRHMSDK